MADPFACLRIEDDEAGSSSQGEDIMQGDVLRKDYKSIPHLDSYSSLAVDDAANLPALSELQVGGGGGGGGGGGAGGGGGGNLTPS